MGKYMAVEIKNKVSFLIGNQDIIDRMPKLNVSGQFKEEVVCYLSDVSRILMKSSDSRIYSDVISFAFWIRKASLKELKKKYLKKDNHLRLGRGVVFHIAPSNVPVNFAYSLVSGLLAGNANIVRVPSKSFEQVDIIAKAFNEALELHPDMQGYITLVRYDRDKDVNDFFSSIADVRVIWGGDQTIAEIRKSPLPPRSMEITFADRYSLAVIDSDVYLTMDNKSRVAEDFYNDTYFSDQNACTSPRAVIWLGRRREEAKVYFWKELHSLVHSKYRFQDIQSVNKLSSAYMAAVSIDGLQILPSEDNLIIRINTDHLDDILMKHMDNSGFFFEYDCDDVMELRDICNNNKCQTIGLIGDKELLNPLLSSGIKGVDRIVPIGHTMDFDLIWDGYNLIDSMSRTIRI